MTYTGCSSLLKNLHSNFSTLLYRGCDTQPLCYNTSMFDFQSYRWYHWLMLTAFVISLPWLWVLYLVLGIIWLGATNTVNSSGSYSTDTHSPRRGRPRSRAYTYKPTRYRPIRSRAVKPYRAPRVRKPKVYKGRLLKSGVRSTYDPVFKRWRNMAKDSTWRPPLD